MFKLITIWLGFFATILLIVFVTTFLEEQGVKDTIATALMSAGAWVALLWCYRKRQQSSTDRLPFFDKTSTKVERVILVVILTIFALPILFYAIYPVIKLVLKGL